MTETASKGPRKVSDQEKEIRSWMTEQSLKCLQSTAFHNIVDWIDILDPLEHQRKKDNPSKVNERFLFTAQSLTINFTLKAPLPKPLPPHLCFSIINFDMDVQYLKSIGKCWQIASSSMYFLLVERLTIAFYCLVQRSSLAFTKWNDGSKEPEDPLENWTEIDVWFDVCIIFLDPLPSGQLKCNE